MSALTYARIGSGGASQAASSTGGSASNIAAGAGFGAHTVQNVEVGNGLARVRQSNSYMRKCLSSERPVDALRHALDIAVELNSDNIPPKLYYELYMAVSDSLRLLSEQLEPLHSKFPLQNLYELVQYTSLALPRLYLMISVGTAYMNCHPGQIEIMMADLFNMARAVCRPLHALFLRHFLDSITRKHVDAMPDPVAVELCNFVEMNRLWVRFQAIAPSSQALRRLEERRELCSLVSGPLVRISSIIGDSPDDVARFRTRILPAVLAHLHACNDPLAQEFLYDVLVHAFPENFVVSSIDLLLSATPELHQDVSVSSVLRILIERLRPIISASVLSPGKQKSDPLSLTSSPNKAFIPADNKSPNIRTVGGPPFDESANIKDPSKTDASKLHVSTVCSSQVEVLPRLWSSVKLVVNERPDMAPSDVASLLLSIFGLVLSVCPKNLGFLVEILSFTSTVMRKIFASPMALRVVNPLDEAGFFNKNTKESSSVYLHSGGASSMISRASASTTATSAGGESQQGASLANDLRSSPVAALIAKNPIFCGQLCGAVFEINEILRLALEECDFIELFRIPDGSAAVYGILTSLPRSQQGRFTSALMKILLASRSVVSSDPMLVAILRCVKLLIKSENDVAVGTKHHLQDTEEYACLISSFIFLIYNDDPLAHASLLTTAKQVLEVSDSSILRLVLPAIAHQSVRIIDRLRLGMQEQAREKAELEALEDLQRKLRANKIDDKNMVDKKADANDQGPGSHQPQLGSSPTNSTHGGDLSPGYSKKEKNVEASASPEKRNCATQEAANNCPDSCVMSQKPDPTVDERFVALLTGALVPHFRFLQSCIHSIQHKAEDVYLAANLSLLAASAADRALLENIAYEFTSSAMYIYEESISHTRAQLSYLRMIISFLFSSTSFSPVNYETLATKCSLYASRLLPRTHQCQMLAACAHLFWNDSRPASAFIDKRNNGASPNAAPALAYPGVSISSGLQPYRDNLRAKEMLQRAVRAAELCMDSFAVVALHVELAENFMRSYDAGCLSVTSSCITTILAMAADGIKNLRDIYSNSLSTSKNPNLVEKANEYSQHHLAVAAQSNALSLNSKNGNLQVYSNQSKSCAGGDQPQKILVLGKLTTRLRRLCEVIELRRNKDGNSGYHEVVIPLFS